MTSHFPDAYHDRHVMLTAALPRFNEKQVSSMEDSSAVGLGRRPLPAGIAPRHPSAIMLRHLLRLVPSGADRMLTEPILAETIAGIRHILGGDLDHIAVDRAVIGLFSTGVKLDTGTAGACATPLRSIPEAVCCPSSAMAMPFPGKLRGRLARELLKDTQAASGIRRAVGVATMNALAEMCWERRATPDVEMQSGVDAYDAAKIQLGEQVVVVGAFVPFRRR